MACFRNRCSGLGREEAARLCNATVFCGKVPPASQVHRTWAGSQQLVTLAMPKLWDQSFPQDQKGNDGQG